MRDNARRGLLLLSLIGATALIAAPVASAHNVNVVGGKTKLILNKKLKKKLAKRDIRVKGTTFTPVRGVYSFHALDDGGGGGIAHKDTLRFRSEDGVARFSRLRIILPPLGTGDLIPDIDESVPVPRFLVAGVEGKDRMVATLGIRRYEVTNDYPGFTGLALRLNEKGARIINKALGTRFFKDGQKLGELSNRSKVVEEGTR